jgi:hypothetical protein
MLILLDSISFLVTNSTNPCFIYTRFGLCLNGGRCGTKSNGDLQCECLTFNDRSYRGDYCEIISTVPEGTTRSLPVVDNTILIVSIVLPILVFFTLMIVVIVVVYFKCVGRKGELRLNTSSAEVVQERGRRRGERRFTPIDRMSLPIDYHEKSTTPYDEGADDDDYVINAFKRGMDDDDDLNNINLTEAINPNVNIPRPKHFSKF